MHNLGQSRQHWRKHAGTTTGSQTGHLHTKYPEFIQSSIHIVSRWHLEYGDNEPVPSVCAGDSEAQATTQTRRDVFSSKRAALWRQTGTGQEETMFRCELQRPVCARVENAMLIDLREKLSKRNTGKTFRWLRDWLFLFCKPHVLEYGVRAVALVQDLWRTLRLISAIHRRVMCTTE